MRAGRHIAAYLPVNLATVLVAFGGLAILTRLLDGPGEYGRYALAMVTLQFVHMALFTWLEASVARFQARAQTDGDEPHFLRTVYATAFKVGLVGIPATCALIWMLPMEPALRNVLIAAVVSTGVQLALNLGFEAHKAAHRIGRYSAVYSTHQVLSFSVGILLIMVTPLRELGPFVGIAVSAAVIAAIDLPFMLRRARGGVVEPERLRRYVAYGMPISLSLVLAYALNSADVYIIKAYMGADAVGQYSAGYNLANRALEVLFIWIAMAMTPIAVSAFEDGGEAASVSVMRDYGAALVWLAMPAAVGLMLVAEPLGFILGETVREGAITVMPWIACAGLLNGFMTYYVQRAFMLSGRTDRFAWVLVVPVILNIALNLWLVPLMGLMGAVWATIASYAVGAVIAVVVARRQYPLPLPVRATLQTALACAIMAGVVLALPETVSRMPDWAELGVKAVTGAAAYLFVSFATDTAGCRGVVQGLHGKLRATKSIAEPAE